MIDVAIVGGSFSGLSAALLLGHSLRSVIVIDTEKPRNQGAAHVSNLLGQDQIPPLELLKKGRRDIERLKTIQWVDDFVDSIHCRQKGDFALVLRGGAKIVSKRVILATGVSDVLPRIRGIEPFWPHNIFHCPYCIGYEVKNLPLSLYSTEEEAYRLALIMHKWSRDFILFTDGHKVLSEQEMAHLTQLNVTVCEGKISHVTGVPGDSIVIHLGDKKTILRRGIFIHLKFKQRAEKLIRELGCKWNDHNLIKVDEFFQTSVPGCYAIGDMALKIQKVSTAIASGTTAAFAIDHELSLKDGFVG